jgi:hypothetical protein
MSRTTVRLFVIQPWKCGVLQLGEVWLNSIVTLSGE